jgi:hypothetical protein
MIELKSAEADVDNPNFNKVSLTFSNLLNLNELHPGLNLIMEALNP